MDILKNLQLKFQNRDGVSVIFVQDSKEGVEISQKIIETVVDEKTALFLSGGRTPKELYTVLTNDQRLKAGAVGLVDERYGDKFHPQSNELMIQQTGFLSYLEKQNIPFYSILEGKSREITANDYDESLRYLLMHFPKSVGTLGIGGDGHIAGIPANSKFKIQNSKLVFEYNDEGGFYKERVTMTFNALAKIDILLVLVFGEDKKEALKRMFEEGSQEEIPARFLRQKGIAEKVILITDQEI